MELYIKRRENGAEYLDRETGRLVDVMMEICRNLLNGFLNSHLRE